MWLLKNKRPTWCHLLFYFTSYVLNMFRILIYPSSGACDYSVELPYWSYCSWFDVLEILCGWVGVVSACNTDTTPTQPHRNSNTHRNKNNTINVVIQQNSRKLLMMDILMSETCWAHKNCNKIASDIKLVFYSSTIQFSIKCTMGNVQNFNVFISDVPSEPCRTVFTICTLHHMLSASSNQGTWDVGSVWKKWERREIPTGFALEFWMSETTRKTKA